MIYRPILHVTGLPGAGKTTFIEAALRALDLDVICMRATRDATLRKPRERRPRSHPELQRYRSAGATNATAYEFPPTHGDSETFYQTAFMDDFSTGVIIEGDCPLEFVDLAVFIAPAPAPKNSLLHRVLRHRDAEQAESIAAMERALESRESLARYLLQGFDERLVHLMLGKVDALERTRGMMREGLDKLRATSPPPPSEHWAVAPAYEGIERAQLVVVNSRSARDKDRCAVLVQDVTRLRKDKAVFDDVIGLSGNRVPITAVVADLRDPRDPGLKKALARVRRGMRNVD